MFEKLTHRTYTRTQDITMGNSFLINILLFQRRHFTFLLLCCDSFGWILVKKATSWCYGCQYKAF